MKYELALKLKQAGFPQRNKYFCEECITEYCRINEHENAKPPYTPNLEELITECGTNFDQLERSAGKESKWFVYGNKNGYAIEDEGSTAIEALSNLYIRLQSTLESF